MQQPEDLPEDLIEAITKWAEVDARIVALALVGSHARGKANLTADIDLIVVCKNPPELLNDQSWTQKFGPGKTSGVEDYSLVQSVRVFYDDGAEVEFGVTSLAWTNIPIDEGTMTVMRNGMRILYDPEKRLKRALGFAQEKSQM
ncbi:MAG: nucleotidyltransferase domain-containing protein [Rhodospirillaceae bacterium]|jgi:hypothetical protein|nr:nucleotidyltransferase domain-containing protein [Rhodospirillaceae bacterium]MBT5666258.1 nucleotidyltransferase domain-containing protein [Rhodospirillaceae bacterium]